MNRLFYFRQLERHAWLGKQFRKLSASERQFCEEFIQRNESLDAGLFEFAVNRMFLDREKPKNAQIILELLTCANSEWRGKKE